MSDRPPLDPPDADEAGREPDYRMSLAAERTYLAYLRTGLALTAGGVGVAGALPHAAAEAFRRVIGVVLVLTGAAVLLLARQRWAAVDRAMRLNQPLPRTTVVRGLSLVLVAVAIAGVVLVLVV
jgi:putative membrane protein